MAGAPNQVQAIQQQASTNEMLNQLPQAQKSQIEQAVNNYRQTLATQGYAAEVIQTYVWTYYTQCVTTLFQDAATKQENGGAAEESPATSLAVPKMVPPELNPEAPPSPSPAPVGDAVQSQGQSQAMQRQQNLQQQRMMFVQQQQMRQQQMQQQSSASQQQAWNGAAKSDDDNGWKSEETGGWNSEKSELMPSKAKASGGGPGAYAAVGLQQEPSAPSSGNGNSGGEWGAGSWQSKTGGQGSWTDSGSWTEPGSSDAATQPSSAANSWQTSKVGQIGQNMANSNQMHMMSLLASTSKGKSVGGPPGTSPVAASWQRPKLGMTGPSVGGLGLVPGGNGAVRFPLNISVRPPPANVIRPTTQAQRMQIAQEQHQNRLQQQWGQAKAFGGPGRPKGATGKGAATGLVGKGGLGGPAFPPALQKWLQRLFAHQTSSGENDPQLQKLTHTYLRHWVQQWVKTGELWQRNWESALLPTPDEIRANKPPGSLSGNSGVGVAAHIAAQMGQVPGGKGAGGPRVIEPPAHQAWMKGGKKGADGQMGFSGAGNKSRDERRQRRSRSRRRRRRSSSSSGSTRSKSRKKRERSEDSSSEDSGEKKDDFIACGGKGKKGKGLVPLAPGLVSGKGGIAELARRRAELEFNSKPAEDQKAQIRKILDERLQAVDGRGRHKELQDELQRMLGVNGKRFRAYFSQTMSQYVAAFYQQGVGGYIPFAADAINRPKNVSKVEAGMRAQRADRFKSHLVMEKANVAMVSFHENGDGAGPGGPLVGTLSDMCSREEAREREMTRQLDKLEWKKGTDPKNPEVNLALATKKYQRSSADKAYRSQDTRTLEAVWRTMEFLMTEILDFDRKPKPQFAVQRLPYIEAYSYLRDRTRSCRVDLHLQQPRSTAQRTFIETHECCLRFEMLSYFLLQGETGGSTEKYDEKMGLKAISQTIEPLLNAYQVSRDKMIAKSIIAELMGGMGSPDEEEGEAEEYSSPFEPAVHRYIVLLLMAWSPEELQSHLAKLSKETLGHPLVAFAIQAYAAFRTEDYGRFLRLYRTADFFTAIAMSGVADLARLRALWLLVRTYCQPVGDKLTVARLCNILAFASESHAKSFLAFHGVKVEADSKGGGAVVVLPKKGTKEAAAHPLLTGPSRLPDKCEYPKGADSMLVSKFEALGLTRADIVFGSADPIAEEPQVVEIPEDSAEVKAANDAEVAAEIAKDA